MNVRIRKFVKRLSVKLSEEEILRFFDNSIFIISAPRSGSTLLFSLLTASPGAWTIGEESHGIYANFPHLAGADQSLSSGRLDTSHADEQTCKQLRLIYLASLKDRNGQTLYEEIRSNNRQNIVFLEKTPRNSLNVNFLKVVFPKARFIYLHRDPRETISSMIEGWTVGAKTGQFVTYRNLPDWPLGYWCFLLPPQWQSFRNKSIAEIAAFQWQACNDIILDDLSQISRDRWISLSYRNLIDDPQVQLSRLCEFCNMDKGTYLDNRDSKNLPISASTVTPPKKDKWKRHEQEILELLPDLQPTIKKIADID